MMLELTEDERQLLLGIIDSVGIPGKFLDITYRLKQKLLMLTEKEVRRNGQKEETKSR